MVDVFGGVIEGIAQIPGTAFLHVRITVFELPRLVGRREHPGISQQLVRGIKPEEAVTLGQHHGAHAASSSRMRRMVCCNSRDLAGIVAPMEHRRHLGSQWPYPARSAPWRCQPAGTSAWSDARRRPVRPLEIQTAAHKPTPYEALAPASPTQETECTPAWKRTASALPALYASAILETADYPPRYAHP